MHSSRWKQQKENNRISNRAYDCFLPFIDFLPLGLLEVIISSLVVPRLYRRGITSLHSTLNGIENKPVAGMENITQLKTINKIQVVIILEILLIVFGANKLQFSIIQFFDSFYKLGRNYLSYLHNFLFQEKINYLRNKAAYKWQTLLNQYPKNLQRCKFSDLLSD